MNLPLQIIDISPIVSADLAVYPGDQKFERQVAMDFKKGDHLELSSMLSTLHIGAHADAPSHYHPKGESIESRDLAYYVGPCRVVHATKLAADNLIREENLRNIILQSENTLPPRILVGTKTFSNPNQWHDDFASFAPETLQWLAAKGVRLVGIDTPSVDPAQSKDLPSHQVLYAKNLAVLEGLVLDHVPAGDYFLVAAPLKLKGCEAAPVRAILLKY